VVKHFFLLECHLAKLNSYCALFHVLYTRSRILKSFVFFVFTHDRLRQDETQDHKLAWSSWLHLKYSTWCCSCSSSSKTDILVCANRRSNLRSTALTQATLCMTASRLVLFWRSRFFLPQLAIAGDNIIHPFFTLLALHGHNRCRQFSRHRMYQKNCFAASRSRVLALAQ